MAELAGFFGRVDGCDEVDHPEASRLLDALPDLLDRLQPQALDRDASSVCVEAEMVTISLVHATDAARSLSVVVFGDEAGEGELFLSGGTVSLTLGWNGPTVRSFGYR